MDETRVLTILIGTGGIAAIAVGFLLAMMLAPFQAWTSSDVFALPVVMIGFGVLLVAGAWLLWRTGEPSS